MALNSDFLLQILDKIGVPLTAAVEKVSARDKSAALSEVEEAKVIAQLIGQTIQVILPLSSSIYQGTNEQEADAVRLALAGIAAPLVAGVYKTHGSAPDENDIKRIVKSMEATLAFSENFNPAVEQASRLKMLGVDTLLFDTAQTEMSVLSAMVPAVNAIGEFSFGQSETKLLQEVTNKLMEKAASIAKGGDKLAELSALKSLASLYAQCHMSETARLSKGGDDKREELSIDPVWKAFDSRMAMVGTILEMPPFTQTAVSSGSGVSPAPTAAPPPVTPPPPQAPVASPPAAPPTQEAPAAPVTPPPVTPPPVQAPAATPPPAAPAAQEAPAAQGAGGPMSFFSGGNNNATPAQPATPPAQAPAAPPPAAPPEQAAAPTVGQQELPPVQAPAAPPPAAPPEQAAPPADGNPMSFFKGPPKTDEQGGS